MISGKYRRRKPKMGRITAASHSAGASVAIKAFEVWGRANSAN